jgi:hypothetical protein
VFIPGEYPETFRLFFEQVVPILQDRGEYPREYAGTTLREHLGLPEPSVAETVAA